MFSLPFEARVAVVSHLVEGNSIRATERLTGVTKKTILRMLVDIGTGCDRVHDRLVRDLSIANIQCDEIWSYVQKKQARVTEEDDPTRGDAFRIEGAIHDEMKPYALVGEWINADEFGMCALVQARIEEAFHP